VSIWGLTFILDGREKNQSLNPLDGTMGRLADEVAIVTGAAQGIGEGIARTLANAGATVILWDISDQVHQTAKTINIFNQKAFSYIVDVVDPTKQVGQ
jgi:NAD(P)-dependent dehydrogenase (short-subunit alcohol dehydrogenase family)